MQCNHTDSLVLVKYFLVKKQLRNLEGKGAKGKDDFLNKYHVIMKYNYAVMEYNINIRMSLTKK
jgi:hypothetical protein